MIRINIILSTNLYLVPLGPPWVPFHQKGPVAQGPPSLLGYQLAPAPLSLPCHLFLLQHLVDQTKVPRISRRQDMFGQIISHFETHLTPNYLDLYG